MISVSQDCALLVVLASDSITEYSSSHELPKASNFNIKLHLDEYFFKDFKGFFYLL